MLFLRNLFFTVLLPGTFTVAGPYFVALRHRSEPGLPHPPWSWLGLLPLCLGAAILFRCIWDFAVTGRGTLAPVDPPKELVVCGLYRYVRNPMYVGVLWILLGESAWFVSARLLIYAAIFFASVHLFVILYEEPALRRKFGDSYERYTRTVHRWLPAPPREPLRRT